MFVFENTDMTGSDVDEQKHVVCACKPKCTAVNVTT